MKIFFILLLISLLTSCGGGDANRPADVLPPKKMQVILWDMIKADELVSYQSGIDTSVNKKGESIKLYSQVLNIHKISEQEFKRSMEFYQKNPKELKVVLDSLRTISERPVPYQRTTKTIS